MISRMKDVLQLTGLSSRADDMIFRYSAGMKVKLTLAAGLMVDNPIYLMDEPFVGIDPAASKEIREFLRRELKTRELRFDYKYVGFICLKVPNMKALKSVS